MAVHFSVCHTDDGGGMDPDSLRRCMSFGFSEKQSGSSIGQCMYYYIIYSGFYPLQTKLILLSCILTFIDLTRWKWVQDWHNAARGRCNCFQSLHEEQV